MNRRGLTLLELLLSLALLSSLTLVSAGWTTTSVRTSRALDARARWETAARATLEVIGEDLAAGDLSRRQFNSERLPNWITFEDAKLAIKVRGAPFSQQVLAVYALDPNARLLRRSQGPQGKTAEREHVLVGDTIAFEVQLVPTSSEPDTRVRLDIRIQSSSGWMATRVFWIRNGDRQ